jgi:membrane carboxypeptidase/penicillin-binding protein
LEDFSSRDGGILLFSYLPLGALEPCLLLKTWKTDSNLATEIISADGVVLGKYFQKNRSQLKYSDLQKFGASLSSDRGRAFFEHSGIDGEEHYRAIASLGTSGGVLTSNNQTIIPW